MNTEIIIYRPNLLKNWNFNSINTYLDNDGVTNKTYWNGVNGTLDDWFILNGKARVTTLAPGNPNMYQENVFTAGKEYTMKIQISALSGGSGLIVIFGTTLASYITGPGNYTITSIADTDILGITALATNITIDWIEVTEAPNQFSIKLNDEVNIPLTFNIADIRDPSKRNGSFSKTINIPGNPTNNKIFNQIYEIDGNCSFNPNKKTKVIIYHDGEQQLNGYLQLKNINRVQNGFNNYDLVSYDVVINGGITDIFTDMGNSLLSELDFSEYSHSYTVNNQEFSWNYGVYKNGTLTQTFTTGLSKSVTDVQDAGDGRALFNFSSAHGFTVGQQVYVNLSDTTAKGYNGDHRIYATPTTTSAVLWFPYIENVTTLAGPTGDYIFSSVATGDGYVYPMIQYGTHIDGTLMNGVDYKVTDFLPAIYLKTYLNKIAAKFGYIFKSNFFSSPDFNRLAMLAVIKSFKPSSTQLNHRAFQATMTADRSGSTVYQNDGTYSPGPPTTYLYRNNTTSRSRNVYPIFDDDFTPPNFDNSNSLNITTGYWTPPVTGTYKLSTNVIYHQDYTIPVNHVIVPVSGIPADQKVKITVQFLDFTASTIVSTTVYYYDVQISNNFTFTKNITTADFTAIAGHNYGVEINIEDAYLFGIKVLSGSPIPFTNNWKIKAGTSYYNTPIDSSYNDGDTVDLTSAVPNMTCKDFMLNLIKMFNLYFEVDKTNVKILTVEPRNDYYIDSSINDWKLDLEETIVLQPMAELNAKQYQFNFKSDKAELNDKHLRVSGYGYGDKLINVDNDFLSSTNKTELTVSSGVLVEFPDDSNRIITGIYEGENADRKRIDGNPRILYFGLASSYGSPAQYWNHTSTIGGSTINNKYIYPYFGHLDKVRGPKYDYNFGYPYEKYFVTDTWTSNNLYNFYYNDMINEIISPNNKLITCSIYLKSSDISKLNFRNRYLIDGHYFRLNKVIDFTPGTTESTKCEFTKIDVS